MELKQLTAAILGAYFGCEVQMDLIETSIGVMVGVDTEYVWVSDDDDRLSRTVKFHEAKLVLRRLESLTDEEVAKVFEIENETAISTERGRKIIKTWVEADCLRRFTLDYLRSIKIDIGYGGIPSLIDAGIAIGKK